MNETIEKTLKSLRDNNFGALFAEDHEVAKDETLKMIPDKAVVGIGDSATIRQSCILGDLKRKKIKVINPFSKEIAARITAKDIDREQWKSILRESLACNVFLTGTNAVTLDGKLVNTDGVGNRVVGMIFGPKRVIIIAGRNKIVKDIHEALYVVKNVIAPMHAKTKKFSTPCAYTGKCNDCSSKHRICNVTTIIEKNPMFSDITVVIVNEDLGLGWNESWPKKRIDEILTKYVEITRARLPFSPYMHRRN